MGGFGNGSVTVAGDADNRSSARVRTLERGQRRGERMRDGTIRTGLEAVVGHIEVRF